MIGCLRTLVRKQPIIVLYFDFETVLKFYNLGPGLDPNCLQVKGSRIIAIYTSNKTLLSQRSIILEREVIHLEYYYICIFQKRPVRIFLESGSLRRKKSTMIAAIECQKNESHLCK